ncbi:MAG: JAB domain-containing protein [Aureispira sp.]|nr:JAB domain-containing protein [Aureispira sp.]
METLKLSSIKTWAEADRPREKMILKGKNALSDAELLAILLGSGSRNESAVELAQKILRAANDNLNDLGQTTLKDLQKHKGVGEAKAITIAAAMELGRRRQSTTPTQRPSIRSSQDAFNILASLVMDLPHEEFWVLILNRANKVLRSVQISSGGLAGTVVDTKKIYQRVLDHERANSIILCHNHPSGNLSPSKADLDVTKKIKAAGQVLDIQVLDHLIISGNSYLSFADEGYL